jgi:hypothetical protein
MNNRMDTPFYTVSYDFRLRPQTGSFADGDTAEAGNTDGT